MFHVSCYVDYSSPTCNRWFFIAKESHPYSRKRARLLREKGETIMGGKELIYDTHSITYFQTNTTPKWTMLR